MATNLPNQRTKMVDKLDKKWYMPTIDYFISACISCNNKNDIQKWLDASNGVISRESLKYVVKPMGEDAAITNLPSDLRDTDIITPIRETQLGEYQGLPYKFTVKVHNEQAVMQMNSDLKKVMYDRMIQGFIAEVAAQGENPQSPDMAAYANKFITDELEKIAKNGLDRVMLFNDITDFEVLRQKMYYYWWATEEFYTYREIVNGEVYKYVINPLEGYPLDNGEEFIEDCPAFLHRRYITFIDFINIYGNTLPEEYKTIVAELFNQNATGKSEFMIPALLYSKMFSHDAISNLNTHDNNLIPFGNPNRILEEKITFTTQKLVQILHYKDQFDYEQSTVVDEDYEFNPENGDLYIEQDYHNTIMTAWRFNGNSGVYIPPVENDIIQRDQNNPSRCKLPYGGKKGILRGIYQKPIPARIIDHQAIFQLYTLVLERTIAKYKGDIMLIPKSAIATDSAGTSKEKIIMMRNDNSLIYDDAKVDFSTIAQGFRVVGNPGLEKFIMGINELRRQIKEEAWELANMNRERFGQAQTSSTVTNSQMNMIQAKTASAISIYMFHKALERDHNKDMEYTKIAWINGKVGSYRDNNGNIIDVAVDGTDNLASQCGIFIVNAIDENAKLKAYADFAFSAAQNGDLELASTAIYGDSSIEIHDKIVELSTMKREFEQSQTDKQLQQQQQTLEIGLQEKAKDRDTELQTTQMNNETAIQVAQINANSKMQNSDSDDDGIPDSIEVNTKERIENNKLSIKQQEIAAKERMNDKNNATKVAIDKNKLKLKSKS